MKVLNKYMVNRLAYIFELIIEEKWGELKFLVDTNDALFGRNRDNSLPDDGGIKEMFEQC